MTATDPIAQVQRYLEAWRHHDARTVLATLAPGGSYEDPLTGGPISGDALQAYMAGLWSAFPDLDFEPGRVHRLDDNTVLATWVMFGHNHGAFQGLPPSGRQVRLEGVDLITGGDEGIARVRGYFDSAVVPRQLGLDVVVQPREIGPFLFGTSTAVRRERPATPSVLAFTELIAASDAHVQPLRELSRQIAIEQLPNPDFLGLTAALQGRRMSTVTAWNSHDALSLAMRKGSHAQAMQSFFKDGVAAGGYTAVFAAVRTGPWWRHCDECGAMSRLLEPEGHCNGCGAPLHALA